MSNPPFTRRAKFHSEKKEAVAHDILDSDGIPIAFVLSREDAELFVAAPDLLQGLDDLLNSALDFDSLIDKEFIPKLEVLVSRVKGASPDYAQWLAEANRYALGAYAIDALEVVQDESRLKDAYEDGDAPRIVVDMYAEKYSLVKTI